MQRCRSNDYRSERRKYRPYSPPRCKCSEADKRRSNSHSNHEHRSNSRPNLNYESVKPRKYEPVRVHPTNYKTIQCRHWIRGHCQFGSRCTFAHEALLKYNARNDASRSNDFPRPNDASRPNNDLKPNDDILPSYNSTIEEVSQIDPSNGKVAALCQELQNILANYTRSNLPN